jgi:PadR family transcriptional regulator, regulatory protein PadR
MTIQSAEHEMIDAPGCPAISFPFSSLDSQKARRMAAGVARHWNLEETVLGSCHGQGIARSIQRQSEEVFFVDHGSLYLALQRLQDKKWISAKWAVSENNRKARFYSLTSKGRAQLVEKTSEWQRLTRAMGLILSGNAEPGVEET